MTVIQIEKMNNKFRLHLYMLLVALISYIFRQQMLNDQNTKYNIHNNV